MRLFIADPGLQANRGHHANGCRYILAAANARGIQTRVLAHRNIEAPLKAELGAEPFFREYTYQFSDGDPYVGWLTAFHRIADATSEDLGGITGCGSGDVFYLQGAQPAQLMAAIDWAATLPERKCPTIVVEMGTEVGVRIAQSGSEWTVQIPNPQADGRPTLFRFAARSLTKLGSRPFHVVTYDKTVSGVYALVMMHPVGVVPFPVATHGAVRSGKRTRPITVGVLGHQQSFKGYHFLPEIIERTFKAGKDTAFLVHNSDPDQQQSSGARDMRATQDKLRKMAKNNPRIVLKEGTTDFTVWKNLLEETDVLLCPYDPVRYATGHSGLVASALANGIPLVVPAGTSMSERLEEFGNPGAAFQRYEADSIVHALHEVLDDFDGAAERALGAARRWADTQGPENFLDLLLKLKTEPNACYRSAEGNKGLTSPERGAAIARHKAGVSLAAAGNAAAALAEFDGALRGCQTYAEAWASRGAVLQKMGRESEAYESYAQAILLTPLYDDAAAKFAEIAEKLGRSSQILTPWNEKPAPKLSARVAAIFGRRQEAPQESDVRSEAVLRERLIDAPADERLVIALAETLQADGRVEEAFAFIRYAQLLAPWDEKTTLLLARIAEMRTDHERRMAPQ